MSVRNNPYGQFNFIVKLGEIGGEDQIVGGFSDFSGAGNEVKFAEYRNGNDKDNHVRKIANLNTVNDVTLKRGLIGDMRLFDWLRATREGNHEPRTITVTLLDEARNEVFQWVLRQAQPKKLTITPLNAKSNDSAVEEMSFSVEDVEQISL
jgi:phage tail-like protein